MPKGRTPLETEWFDAVLVFANDAVYLEDGGRNFARRRAWAKEWAEKYDANLYVSDAGAVRIIPGAPLDWQFEVPGLDGSWHSRIGDANDFDTTNLRELLGDLADHGPTKELWSKLSGVIEEVAVTGSMSLGPEIGSFSIKGTLGVDGKMQALAVKIATLIERGYGDRVRRCELPTCNNFFVAWDKRRMYCSDSHASQDRTAASKKGVDTETLRFRRKRRRGRSK